MAEGSIIGINLAPVATVFAAFIGAFVSPYVKDLVDRRSLRRISQRKIARVYLNPLKMNIEKLLRRLDRLDEFKSKPEGDDEFQSTVYFIIAIIVYYWIFEWDDVYSEIAQFNKPSTMLSKELHDKMHEINRGFYLVNKFGHLQRRKLASYFIAKDEEGFLWFNHLALLKSPSDLNISPLIEEAKEMIKNLGDNDLRKIKENLNQVSEYLSNLLRKK
jgi:hypothetical protein